MSLWAYVFFRVNSGTYNKTCQEDGCTKPAVYQLTAKKDDKEASRLFCVNHSAASAARVGVAFPPVESQGAK